MSGPPDKKKIPILMYHSISPNASKKYRPFAITPALFAEQMAYLGEHGYTPITVSRFIEARSRGGEGLPERPVLLTFDDGFADFYTGALPVLRRYSFSATLYIVTAFMNGTSRWLWHEGEADRPMLTWEQVREINAAGIECGGHTHTHPQLDTIPLVRARDELVRCKRILEDHLGQEVRSFAYPFGYHTAEVKDLVREVGYSSACAVRYEMCAENTDPFALTRLKVSSTTDTRALAALLTSGYPSMLSEAYKRTRVPLWRMVRRGLAPVVQRFHGELQYS